MPEDDCFLVARKTGRPLRVLITRPDEQAVETAHEVRAAGGEPLLFPCLHRAPPADPDAFLCTLARLHEFAVVVVSSANTASALAQGLRQLGHEPAQALGALLVAAVGPRTAAALSQQGIAVHVTAEQENTSAGLALAVRAALQARQKPLAQARIFFPRAAEASATLSSQLGAAGAEVVEAVAYQMVAATAQDLAPLGRLLQQGCIDLAPFGSPRTARIALGVLQEPMAKFFDRQRLVVGALGPSTAAALHALGLPADIVAHPATFTTLLHLMGDRYQKLMQFQ